MQTQITCAPYIFINIYDVVNMLRVNLFSVPNHTINIVWKKFPMSYIEYLHTTKARGDQYRFGDGIAFVHWGSKTIRRIEYRNSLFDNAIVAPLNLTHSEIYETRRIFNMGGQTSKQKTITWWRNCTPANPDIRSSIIVQTPTQTKMTLQGGN